MPWNSLCTARLALTHDSHPPSVILGMKPSPFPPLNYSSVYFITVSSTWFCSKSPLPHAETILRAESPSWRTVSLIVSHWPSRRCLTRCLTLAAAGYITSDDCLCSHRLSNESAKQACLKERVGKADCTENKVTC